MVNQLDVRVGFHSAQGNRDRNDDYGAVFLGTPSQRQRQGIVAALADGMGGAKAGRVAAELATRGLIDGYYGQSKALSVRRAVAVAVEAANRWIYSQGRANPAFEGMACTLTGLILRGRQAHVVHVGDTRLYRLRNGQLTRLTSDHVLDRPDFRHVLTSAVGIEQSVRADYAVEATRLDDRFLLCTDGVHGSLRDPHLCERLLAPIAPEECARTIVASALAAGSNDNATALVVDVIGLPTADRAELLDSISALPVLAPPETGDEVDGYELGPALADGRYSRTFKARDRNGGSEVVLKFPKPNIAERETIRLAFLRERWVSSRVRSSWIGEVIEPPPRQTRLYSVMPYYAGETLEQRLNRKPEIGLQAGLRIGIRLANAVAALHRAGIVHRDIKPDNVILLSDGGPKLIDLGVARLANGEDFPDADVPGTPSYMAPELFAGRQGDERSDQFALGVTLYRMFAAGAYPYGEIEPFSHPRFAKPTSLLRHRPDLPGWLDAIVARAIAVNPAERLGDVVEFSFELENGVSRTQAPAPRRRPLYERNPVLFWQAVSLVLLGLLVLSIGTR